MDRNFVALALLGSGAWLMTACQGPTLPLSAQQGSSILIPIGNADTVSQGLIGFGGTLRADPQRGQMNYYLDALPPTGFPLVTRTTSTVEPSRQSVIGRHEANYPVSVSPYMVVSLVEIPTNAPTGTHSLIATRQRGTEPATQVPYQGQIKILPSPEAATGIAGAISTFKGAPVTGGVFSLLTSTAPDMVPDPMVVVRIDPPVHSVELYVYVPPTRADVKDVIDTLHADRSAAHPALVSSQSQGGGVFVISAIASRDDLPIDEIGVVFQLKANAMPLIPGEIAVVPTLATDENGDDVLPIDVYNAIQ